MYLSADSSWSCYGSTAYYFLAGIILGIYVDIKSALVEQGITSILNAAFVMIVLLAEVGDEIGAITRKKQWKKWAVETEKRKKHS